jgi:Zn-dependent protease/CBS domain-containing protein
VTAAWKIGRLGGVVVRVHATFPLLLLWIGAARYFEHRQWSDALGGVLFTLTLFAFVTVHELGHATVARRCGVRTRDITLLPIGGIARLERQPSQPRDELMIALAGPAVNLVLAGAFSAALLIQGHPIPFEPGRIEQDPAARLAWINVSLAGFNLLPALPMDGGRALRALLAMRTNPLRATLIAAAIGRGFALALGLLGLAGNPILVLIALFVWLGAGAESDSARTRHALARLTVADVMQRDFHVLMGDDTLRHAVRLALAGGQRDFPVIVGERVAGTLRWNDLVQGLRTVGPDATVAQHLSPRSLTTTPVEGLNHLLDRTGLELADGIPVLDHGRLAGLFTLSSLSAALVLREAAATPSKLTTRMPTPRRTRIEPQPATSANQSATAAE